MPAERSSSVDDGGIRKKRMRKGTHSCFECRRRKIRCIFTPDNPSVCTECFARGSRCVDQENAESDVVVDHRKNLRERVARLEALIETLVDDKSEKHAAEALRSLGTSDNQPPTPHSEEAPSDAGSARIPVLSLFDNAVLSRAGSTSGSMSGISPANTTTLSAQQATLKYTSPHADGINAAGTPGRIKNERVRQALMPILPSYAKLLPVIKSEQHMWAVFQRKCPGTRGNATIEEFAARVMARGTPCEIGLLVLLYGSCQEGDALDQCIALVDRWILSDDEYMGTLEGLECAIFMGKLYADIGQARKSWLAFRRGLTFAQLMGLHRNHALSIPRESIWWSLYGADRLTSLMLGMPYGIPDIHCNLDFMGQSIQTGLGPLVFFAKMAYFAGRVIDRAQMLQDATYESALDLDKEFGQYARQLPSDVWNNQPLLDCDDANVAYEWQEKLLGQIAFYQIKAYLHMPFMLKNEPTYEPSSKACIESAREILRLYHMLRADGTPLYECKAVDFIAFTACILLVLGLLGYGRLSGSTVQQEEQDWDMLERSMDIFKRASSEKGGKVAAQSYQALEQLHQLKNDGPNSGANQNITAKIVIPFFGTISVQRGAAYRHNILTPSSTSTPQSHSIPTPATPDFARISDNAASAYSSMDPQVMYDGFYIPPASLEQPHVPTEDPAFGSLGGGVTAPGASSGYWPGNWGNMDLDQDWSWFMSELQGPQSMHFNA